MGLHKIGRIDYCMQIMKTADCDNSIVLKCLGILYAMKGDYKESEEYFIESLRMNEDDIDCNANYANMLFKLGRYDEALNYFKKAFKDEISEKYFQSDNTVINYVDAMCLNEKYQDCVNHLLRIQSNGKLTGEYLRLTHCLIVEIHLIGNMIDAWNDDDALKHFQFVYKSNNINREIKNEKFDFCCLI